MPTAYRIRHTPTARTLAGSYDFATQALLFGATHLHLPLEEIEAVPFDPEAEARDRADAIYEKSLEMLDHGEPTKHGTVCPACEGWTDAETRIPHVTLCDRLRELATVEVDVARFRAMNGGHS